MLDAPLEPQAGAPLEPPADRRTALRSLARLAVHLGLLVSAAAAAASKLRAEALADFLAGWEAEHGTLTAQEIARAERDLGIAAADSAA
jgi:hypothetical protein